MKQTFHDHTDLKKNGIFTRDDQNSEMCQPNLIYYEFALQIPGPPGSPGSMVGLALDLACACLNVMCFQVSLSYSQNMSLIA